MYIKTSLSATIFMLIILICPLSSIFQASSADSSQFSTPTSIILLVGDGMGLEHIKFGQFVEYGEEQFSSLFTFPYNTTVSTKNIDNIITDSAASATAISTGVKTRNGRIATNWNGKQSLTTILEIAQMNDYSTGLVATSHLAHATPAAFATHEKHRNDYSNIVQDYITAGVDVLLGGGYSEDYFGNYLDDFIAQGYNKITTKDEFNKVNNSPVLGLFAPSSLIQMQYWTDESSQPTLSQMTLKAIDLLNSSGKPFFLMIEGSRIDWAAHDNDPLYLAHEMIEFERTVAEVKTLAEQNLNWQVLVTADHETGGLTIQDYNFTTSTPHPSDCYETKKTKRDKRASEVSVKWKTVGHTARDVLLAGMGPNAEHILSAEHHIDTFGIMREMIDGENTVDGKGYYDGFFSIYSWITVGSSTIAVIVLFFVVIKKKKI